MIITRGGRRRSIASVAPCLCCRDFCLAFHSPAARRATDPSGGRSSTALPLLPQPSSDSGAAATGELRPGALAARTRLLAEQSLNPWMATASSTELAAGDCTAAPSHTSSISHAPAPLPQAYQGFLISPPTPSGFLACSLCTSHSSSPLPSCWDWDGLGSGDEEGILMCIVGDFFRKMCFLHVSQCMNSAVRDAASLPPSGPCENYKRKRSLDSELGEASLSRGDGKTCPYARLQNAPLFFVLCNTNEADTNVR
jgi:hypothetical protein